MAREGGDGGVGAGLEGATGPPLRLVTGKRHIAVQRVIPCRKVQGDGARFGRCIDAHGVPGVTGAPGKDHVSARISVDEADFVPLRGHVLHEVHGPLRGVREVVRGQGEVLDGALEEDGRRQGEDVRRAADCARERRVVRRVIDLVQGAAAEVHRRHRIPDERVQAGVEGLRIVPNLREMQVFARQDCLGRGEVRVHPLPAAGQRAAMENHNQAEVVGIGQDVLVELHRLLLVGAEEVHLDAPDADALHPLHLPPAGNAPVHDVPRPLRRIVPVAVGIVPETELDALGPGIGRQFLNSFPANPGVPPVVHEHRLPAHRRAEIDILLLGVEVDAVVHLDDPAPGTLGAAVGLGGRILRFHDIPRHGRLRNGFQVHADGDGPPRRISRHRNSGRHRPVPVELLLHRETQPVGSVGKADESSAAIVPMDTGLAQQDPSLVPVAEQAGEHVAIPVPVLAQGVIGRVGGLVTRRRAGKSRHRRHLRAQEGSRSFRKNISGRFFQHPADLGRPVRGWNPIAESDVVRAYPHLQFQNNLLFRLADSFPVCTTYLHEAENTPVRPVVHRGELDRGHAVIIGHRILGETGQQESLGEIPDIGPETQRRRLQEGHAVIGYGISGLSALVRDRYNQPAVRPGHPRLVRRQGQSQQQCTEIQYNLLHHVQRYEEKQNRTSLCAEKCCIYTFNSLSLQHTRSVEITPN